MNIPMLRNRSVTKEGSDPYPSPPAVIPDTPEPPPIPKPDYFPGSLDPDDPTLTPRPGPESPEGPSQTVPMEHNSNHSNTGNSVRNNTRRQVEPAYAMPVYRAAGESERMICLRFWIQVGIALALANLVFLAIAVFSPVATYLQDEMTFAQLRTATAQDMTRHSFILVGIFLIFQLGSLACSRFKIMDHHDGCN